MNCMQQRCLSMNLFKLRLPHSITSVFKRTAKNEDGIMTVEAVIVLPLLFWAIWASYNFFDGYRQSSRNLKATYAIADIVSRERSTINSTYIDSLHDILQTMVDQSGFMTLRVTFFRYDKAEDAHYILWSCARGEAVALPEGRFGKFSLLPEMPDNGKMIYVETFHLYQRPFKFLWGEDFLLMDNTVFTHPRVYDNINVTTEGC